MPAARSPLPRAVAAALALAAALAWPAVAAQGPGPALGRAEELIEAGRFEEAGEVLAPLFRRDPPAEAFLLRSTLRFVDGDREAGRRDLERALELAPDLRQAWLNLAALDLSERRYDAALSALKTARDLDPSAIDNPLNLGAVLVLTGQLDEAAAQFDDYLRRRPGSADAEYLVATNFAMAGVVEPALDHLRNAIALDERSRSRARTDPNFSDLETAPAFAALMHTDAYRPAPDAHTASRTFEAPFEAGRGRLLKAVLNALQLSGRPVEQQIEVTPEWALIWSDVRVKVRAEGPDRGVVELSAPAERFDPAAWTAESDQLFREIAAQLIQLGRPF